MSICANTPLLLDNVLQPRDHLVWGQRAEAKPGAARLQSRDDLGQVVTDQTESSVFGELLDYCSREREREKRRFMSVITIN